MLNVKQMRVLSCKTNCFYWVYWAIQKSKETFIILEVSEILEGRVYTYSKWNLKETKQNCIKMIADVFSITQVQ